MRNLYTLIKALGFRRSLAALILCILAAAVVVTCYDSTTDHNLDQAQRALYQIMGPENLEYAGFFDEYPEARPSDFVEFMNTDKGQILWPQTVSEFYNTPDPTRGPGDGPDRYLQPNNVDFSPYDVDPSKGAQVVYIPHDDLGQIEFKGYQSPDENPFQTSMWDFPSTGKKIDF